MRIFFKCILLFAIILFAFFNYQFITFAQGISKSNYDDMTVLEAIEATEDLVAVRYYKKTVTPGSNSEKKDYIYRVYIETENSSYLLDGTQADIDAFKTIFSSKSQPRKVIIVPFYVEIVVGLIILIIPFGKRKKKKTA